MPTKLLRSAELRDIEARHADVRPPLMERAGKAAAAFALDLLGKHPGRVLICAGPGNNGGDGFVMGRELTRAGMPVTMLCASDPARLSSDAAAARATCRAAGADFCSGAPSGEFALVVDALFGIGLARPVEGIWAGLIARINAFPGPVLALDIPSGLDADSGRVPGIAVRATHTLSFIGGKPGLYTLDGPDQCGEISVADLGLDLAAYPGAVLSFDDFRACLKPRSRNSHKGSYGSLAVAGGAAGMSGAALLAGRAGLQLGAGRVFVGLLQPLAIDPVQPELMLRSPDNALAHATTAVIGPGMGAFATALDFLRRAVSADCPSLFDADALNLLAAHPVLAAGLARRSQATLLTPHPAEAGRLLGSSTAAVQADRVAAALQLAQRFKAHVALKGCGTVVAHPDGRWRINTSGNPGLASGGSGDVLSGFIGALLAQGWAADAALAAAVHLHGAAAEALTAAGDGPIGIAAGDLIPAARRLLNRWIARLA